MIDTEYVGQEDKIKGALLEYARQKGLDLSKRQVFFAQVGKKSKAHKMAWVCNGATAKQIAWSRCMIYCHSYKNKKAWGGFRPTTWVTSLG